MLHWLIYSPAVALPLCVLLFALKRRASRESSLTESLVNFLLFVAIAAVIVTMPVIFWVVVATSEEVSGNGLIGLLALLPGAASVGALLGGVVSILTGSVPIKIDKR